MKRPAIPLADVVRVLRTRADALEAWAAEWKGSPTVGEVRHAQVLAQVAELRNMAESFQRAHDECVARSTQAEA